MVIWKEAGRLTDERIESFTEKMTAAYQKAAGKRAGNVTAFSLMAQEVLLRFRDTYGTETPCVITGQKRFGRIQFTISQQVPQADPMHREVDMDFSYDILQLELLLAAKKLGLVDMDRLKREEKDTVA